MPKTAAVVVLKAALTRERRTNRRLRAIITELREDLLATRRDLDVQFTRLAQLQAAVDALTRRQS